MNNRKFAVGDKVLILPSTDKSKFPKGLRGTNWRKNENVLRKHARRLKDEASVEERAELCYEIGGSVLQLIARSIIEASLSGTSDAVGDEGPLELGFRFSKETRLM